MGDRFVPLHAFVLPAREPEMELLEPAVVASEIAVEPAAHEASSEARRFRAAVRDAVDVTVAGLLCDIAADVLARELRLAPADLDAIVTRACERFANEGIVRVRVHPDEAAHLAEAGVDVTPDNALRRGDAMLDVRTGTIDVSLGARLAQVLDGIAR